MQVNLVNGADPSPASPPSGKPRRKGAGFNPPRGPGMTKERRSSRISPLRSHEVVAELLGFTNRDVLSPSPTFLTGVRSFVLPAFYEPLGESARLSAMTRREIMKHRDKGSFELASSRHADEFWYMDWTHKFDESLSRNKYGLVFVESETWLLRVRFFPEKSVERLVEGIEWLRSSVHRTTRRDLLEVHGDSDTSGSVP